MNDTLESQLRETLAARADEVPVSAVRRVRNRDYRPRTRDLRPPVAGGALACAAVAGGLAVTLGLSHPSPAFAGWKAHPTSAKRNEVSDAGSSCIAKLQAMPGSAADRAAAGKAGAPTLPPLSSMSQVLSDTRGPFTFIVYANSEATASAACFDAPGFTSASEMRAPTPMTVARNGMSVVRQAHAVNQGGGYTFIEGQAGSGVSAVTLNLSDGSTVQATVQNGWFAAWWPGNADAPTASLTTATGTITATLPAADLPSCPPSPGGDQQSSCGSSSSSASGRGPVVGVQSAGGSSTAGASAQNRPRVRHLSSRH